MNTDISSHNLGIIAGINILIDVLRSQNKIDTDRLALMLQAKINEWRESLEIENCESAFVLEQILRPLLNEDLHNAHKLLEEPAVGNS